MYIVERTESFEAAHRLMKYKGKCSNIHGHNYVIKIGIESSQLDKNGMVVDFAEIKNTIKTIIEGFDHSIILNREDPLTNLLYQITKVYIIDGEPTAENIINEIRSKIYLLFYTPNYKLLYIKIEETPNSIAEWRAND